MVHISFAFFVVSFEIMVLNVKTTAQNLQLIKFSSEIIYNYRILPYCVCKLYMYTVEYAGGLL